MRTLLLTAVIATAACFMATSAGATSRHFEIHKQMKRYYHADGIIKSIGRVAYRTQYSPNPRIRHKWTRALHWLIGVRKDASAKIYRLRHPYVAPAQQSGGWAEFSCIHSHEGAANANTGNGYYGGLQMDIGFQTTYGAEFLRQWGYANHWPVWAQVTAARRARDGYNGYHARGYSPWPNTARMCGQL